MTNSSLEQVKEYTELIVDQGDGLIHTYPMNCFFEYREGALVIVEEKDDSIGTIAIYHANQWIKAYYTPDTSVDKNIMQIK